MSLLEGTDMASPPLETGTVKSPQRNLAVTPERGIELRLSVTDRCQLRCCYCRTGQSGPRPVARPTLSFEQILRAVRALGRRFALTKVRFTGGEPLLRPGLNRLVRAVADEGVPDLAMTTNGQLLADAAASLKEAGLGRVNISLDSLNARTYRMLTGGLLRRTLAGIDAALTQGLTPVKLNTVMLRGHNLNEALDLARFALRTGCQIRFLELMPIGPGAALFGDAFVSCRQVRQLLSQRLDLRELPRRRGATSRDFLAADGRGHRGVVGFISPCSEPFCDGCRRLRLTSTGELIGCLKRTSGPHVASLLRGPAAGDQILCQTATAQIEGKAARAGFRSERLMVGIGG